jgi:hypothetical protein
MVTTVFAVFALRTAGPTQVEIRSNLLDSPILTTILYILSKIFSHIADAWMPTGIRRGDLAIRIHPLGGGGRPARARSDGRSRSRFIPGSSKST